MKVFISIFSVIAILSIQFRLVFPVLDYTLHKEYVQKVLCINKEKPQLKCEGKCYLAQKLKEAAYLDEPLEIPLHTPLKINPQRIDVVSSVPKEFKTDQPLITRWWVTSEEATSQVSLSPLTPPPIS